MSKLSVLRKQNISIEVLHPLNDHISNHYYNNSFYDEATLNKIKDLNVKGTYVDVGAHIGNHSLFFKLFCNSDKVISIEGNTLNYNFLITNIKQNNLNENIISYNNIIDEYDDIEKKIGHSTLYNNNSGCSLVIENDSNINNYNYIQINKTKKLDTILKNETNITLIKLDIEGYEYQALQGCRKTIEKYHPIIVIELHTESINGKSNIDCATNKYEKDIRFFLEEYNYKIHYKKDCDYIFV